MPEYSNTLYLPNNSLFMTNEEMTCIISNNLQVLPLTHANHPRSHSATVYYQHKIYLFGGVAERSLSNKGEVYSINNNEWQELSDMPVSRKGCTATVAESFIYISSGI